MGDRVASPSRIIWDCIPFERVGPLEVGATLADLDAALGERSRRSPARYPKVTKHVYGAAGIFAFTEHDSDEVVEISTLRRSRYRLRCSGITLTGSFEKLATAWKELGYSVREIPLGAFWLQPGLGVGLPEERTTIDGAFVYLRDLDAVG